MAAPQIHLPSIDHTIQYAKSTFPHYTTQPRVPFVVALVFHAPCVVGTSFGREGRTHGVHQAHHVPPRCEAAQRCRRIHLSWDWAQRALRLQEASWRRGGSSSSPAYLTCMCWLHRRAERTAKAAWRWALLSCARAAVRLATVRRRAFQQTCSTPSSAWSSQLRFQSCCCSQTRRAPSAGSSFA